ncbi:MAG TPA: P-loop NTPase [Acidimicrobiia bacterium]|nr:P-loop NTPase [Acidimicrobiia bacterium]
MRPVLITGTTDAFARRMYAAVDEVTRERVRLWSAPPTESGGLDSLLQANPAVVVIGPALVDSVTIKLAERIDADRPDIGVVIVLRAEEKGNTSADDAMAAGVRGVLFADSDADAIQATIGRAVQVADRHSAGTEQTSAASRGRVTTILSPKGGAGKTMLSTNLAVGLASRSPRGVVIVDLDLQFGDVGYALGLKPRHTVYDAVATSGELDITTLKMFLTHHRSDLYALCAPDEPARGEVVTVDAVERIIELLAGDFDHVVVDTVAGLSEHSLATIDHSTDIVFLADMDVPSVRHLSKVVTAFDALGMTRHRRHFVLNRADARVGMSMVDVATSAGLEIDLQIPISKQVPVTVNEGNPIILSSPKNPVSRAIWELIEKIAGKSGRDQLPTLKRSA